MQMLTSKASHCPYNVLYNMCCTAFFKHSTTDQSNVFTKCILTTQHAAELVLTSKCINCTVPLT